MDSKLFERSWGLEWTFGTLVGETGVDTALLLIERVREGAALHRRDAKLRSCKVVMEET